MSSTLYFLTRCIATIIGLDTLLSSLYRGISTRDSSFLLCVITFMIISHLYERKRKLFSVGYIFLFVVMFLSCIWGPYIYIYSDSLREIAIGNLPEDHYWIYFIIYMSVSLLVIIYLLKITPNKKLGYIIQTDDKRSKQLLITMLVISPIWLTSSSEIVKYILVFITSYYIITFYSVPEKRKQKSVLFGFLLSVFAIIRISTWRFILIKYALPILLFIIFKYTFPYSKKINYRYLKLIALGCIAVLSYGVISEIYKLLGDKNLVLELATTFSSFDTLKYWANRQLFRIVTIWTFLGGNIIEYVDAKGFFYGLTFIKPLAGIFGFPYISLPLISASIIDASYAQPGIIAEGYANFGIIGGVLNCFIVFLIAELMLDYYKRKGTMFSLLLMLVCFTQVLLDGGTINSIVFMASIGFITYYGLDFLKRVL